MHERKRIAAFSCIVAVTFLAVSLGGKIMYYGQADQETDAAVLERVTAFLDRRGWTPLEGRELMLGRAILRFQAPGCERAIEAMLMAPNGETLAALEDRAGPDRRLIYIEEGHPREALSRTAYVRFRLSAALGSLGLGDSGAHALLAVIEPGECEDATQVPWSEFRMSDG